MLLHGAKKSSMLCFIQISNGIISAQNRCGESLMELVYIQDSYH